MANTLVTGGAGFIGSHIATRLVELGHAVRVLDDLSTGRRENLAHIRDKVELLEADMCDPAACARACADVDYVFHEAAIPSVPKSVDHPEASHNANMTGTFNMLHAAVGCKVRRFIYAGSSSAYGDTEVSPKHEEIKPAPLSPYAVQKLAGEHYCLAFARCFGIETITLRYFNVFGPRQDPHSTYAAVIPAFVTAILRGESPVIYGDGEQTRDFTYIDNVVLGNMLAMQAGRTEGETVNIACGDRITVNQIVDAINTALGSSVKAVHKDARAGDVRHSCADVTKARDLLNFEPCVTFQDGLDRAIEYYRSTT